MFQILLIKHFSTKIDNVQYVKYRNFTEFLGVEMHSVWVTLRKIP